MHTFTYSERNRMFDSLFEGYSGAPFCIRLWDGWSWTSPALGEPRCTLLFNSPSAFEALVLHPSEITLGEAFLAGDINVTGDIFEVFAVTEHVFRCPQGRRKKILETFSRLVLGVVQWWKKGTIHSV